MEQKIILGMLGGFVAFTVMAIVVVYSLSAELSFATFLPKKSSKAPQTDQPTITLDPKPQQIITEPTEQPVATADPVRASSVLVDSLSLYSLINAHRKEQGLSALRAHSALELSSRKKLEDMRANKYWQHENREGVMDWSIFDQSGYHYSKAGENLSFGNNSAWAVFNSWVNSSIHNEQMLMAEYEDMGAAIDCESYQEGSKKKCAVVLHLGREQ